MVNLGQRKKKEDDKNTTVTNSNFENSSTQEENIFPKEEKEKVVKQKPKKNTVNKKQEELDFYNSLSESQKKEYDFQMRKKKEFFTNLVVIVVVFVIGFIGQTYLSGILNAQVDENLKLKKQADKLQVDILKYKNTEGLLEDVAISGKMSQAIYEQRDEILDLLESVEAFTPNDLTFKLNKIQKLGKDVFKIDYELVPIDDPKNLNKAILDTAYMVETFQKSKAIASVAKRDVRSFVITEFKGTSYAKSTKTFPLSLTVRLVEKNNTEEGLKGRVTNEQK